MNKKDTLRVKEELKKLFKEHCMYYYDEVIQETVDHQEHSMDQSIEQQFINYPLNIVYSCCDCNSAKNKDTLRDRYKEVYGLVKPNKEKCYEITSSIYRYSTGIFNPITNKISKIIELSLPVKKFTVILLKESDKVRDYILKERDILRYLNVINYFLELERNEGFEKVLKEAEKIMISSYFH